MDSLSGSATLTFLIVTENRALARQLSQFLSSVGYQAIQASQPDLALAAVEARSPEIVLIDFGLASRDDWQLCRTMTEHYGETGPFKILLADQLVDDQAQEALEAGIDDVLQKPISYGELLSRSRAAARVLEFDRRVCQQRRVDTVTGLLNRSAFIAQLQNQWIISTGTSSRVACAVLDVDFFSRIQRAHGTAAGCGLIRAVAQELDSHRVGWEVLWHLGEDRFCKMLPGANDLTAFDWAERTRQVLSGTQFKLGDSHVRITVSVGVASSDTARNAEELLEHATAALEAAKSSGRNAVVRWSELGHEPHESYGLDKLFERTVAGDVMTPCSIVLQADEQAERAAQLLDRTRLEAIPVVDADGRLLGLCRRPHAEHGAGGDESHEFVEEVMTRDVQQFSRTDDFGTVMRFFTDDPLALAAVVEDGRPVGLLNCDSLLALSRPIANQALAPRTPFSSTSDYLVVPDEHPQECDASA